MTQVILNNGSVDSAGSLVLKTNGTTAAVTIDTSQNVGIGTANPNSKVQIVSATAGATAFSAANTSATGYGMFVQGGTSGNYLIYASDYAGTNRMILDGGGSLTLPTGNLLVGTTSTSYGSIGGCKLTVDSPTSGGAALVYTAFAGDVSTSALNIGKFDNNSTSSQIFVKFAINNAGAGSGQINANGSGAATFASFSDSRLKENIVDLPSQLANICALRPVEFDYIEAEGGGHQIGFIAQEVQTLYPDTVAEREDGMLTLSGWSKTEARLVKAIQEQQAIITTQQAAIEQLRADVAELKAK